MRYANFGAMVVLLLGGGVAHAQQGWIKPGANVQEQVAAIDQCGRQVIAMITLPAADSLPAEPAGSLPGAKSKSAVSLDRYSPEEDPYAPGSIAHIEGKKLAMLCMQRSGWTLGSDGP